MNDTILTVILCAIASLLTVIICNYNRCKYRFKYCYYNKKSKGITSDEMKIIIDDIDDFENNKNNNKDENELL
jgi:hypothetical protein